jgi:pantoate kinase
LFLFHEALIELTFSEPIDVQMMRVSLSAGAGVSSSGASSLAEALALLLPTAALSNATTPAAVAALVANVTATLGLASATQL